MDRHTPRSRPSTWARVIKVLRCSGPQGQCAQVRVQILGKRDSLILRNVKGPVREGAILTFSESEREARRLP